MMNHKPLVLKQSAERQYDNIPAGRYPCICTGVVDVGTHESFWNNKPKKKRSIRFIFTFPTKTYKTQEGEERPCKIVVSHTFSLFANGHLLPFLQAWRGTNFTEKELSDGVDISQFLGKTMLANVAYQEDNSYPNIIGHMPLPEEMTCPETDEELLFYTVNNHDDITFRKLSKKTQEKIAASEEMQIGSGSNTDEHIQHTPTASTEHIQHTPTASTSTIQQKERVSIEDVPF